MPEPIRIAFIEQDTGIGGAEVNLFSLLERLDPQRFEPVVIVPYPGPLTKRLEQMGVRYQVIPRPKLISTSTFIFDKKCFNPFAVIYDVATFIPCIFRISRFLRKERVHVVHTNAIVAHFYGALAARMAGVPCVWHMQDIVDPKMALGIVRRGLVYFGGILPNKIVAVSHAVGNMFTGKSSSKIKIVYNGTDCKRFSPEVDGSGIRKEFGIRNNEFVVGIIGRLAQWKGQKEFLQAAAKVAESASNVKFIVVGDTTFNRAEFKEELIQFTKELALESKVIFTGMRNDVQQILKAMDVLVHCSILPEPFGLVIVEGMAAGVPVIAANQGGPCEIIISGEDGFLVDPHKSDELATAILLLLNDESLRRKISNAARIKVEGFFAVELFVHNFEVVYQEVSV